MEQLYKDYGTLILKDGKPYDYVGGSNGDGIIYKDETAFDTGNGVCYISEIELLNLHEKLKSVKSEEERENILKNTGETRESIIDQVRNAYAEDYMLSEEQIVSVARALLHEITWECVTSKLTDDFWLDDFIEFDNDFNGKNRVFTHHQYEAIMNDMTPKEFGDRQLSYGELAELDREFDDAFIVDENCPDDWSDNGLGANARLTYIEQRRRGEISGPEEFDCQEQFRK